MPTIRLDGMLPFVIVAREHATTNRTRTTRKVILHLTTGTLTVSASAPYVGWPPTLWSRRLSEACVFLHCVSCKHERCRAAKLLNHSSAHALSFTFCSIPACAAYRSAVHTKGRWYPLGLKSGFQSLKRTHYYKHPLAMLWIPATCFRLQVCRRKLPDVEKWETIPTWYIRVGPGYRSSCYLTRQQLMRGTLYQVPCPSLFFSEPLEDVGSCARCIRPKKNLSGS